MKRRMHIEEYAPNMFHIQKSDEDGSYKQVTKNVDELGIEVERFFVHVTGKGWVDITGELEYTESGVPCYRGSVLSTLVHSYRAKVENGRVFSRE